MTPETAVNTQREAIAQALHAHARGLRRFVAARVPASCVDDVLQTAALRALDGARSLDDPERAVAWLYRVHRNVIADTLRRRASQARMLEREASTPRDSHLAPTDGPCRCGLTQARHLKPAYAAVLDLVDAGDASLAEAAEALGVSVNNATVRLHRARKALRAAMLDHCGVQSARDCVACRCVFDGCCAV